MAKEKGLYSTQPVVKPKRIAGTNPVGTPSVGSLQPRIVPSKPAELHGLGPVAHNFPQRHVKGAHGYGHIHKEGNLRLSGFTGAHRLGGKASSKTGPKVGF
jgi:hypothetical protein